MKKLFGILMSAMMCFAALFSFTACGAKKGENELWIKFFKGGYGEEWAYSLARKFESENEGVVVKTDPDSLLIDAVEPMLKNGTEYDLIFCHDVPWENFVAEGYIENLDSMYESEVEDGVKFKDRIWDDEVLASANYNGSYYKVPWTIGTAGIAYNITVMDKVDAYLSTQGIERRWNKVPPKTYTDLLQYASDVAAAEIPYGAGVNASTVAPFSWSGTAEQWQWDYAVFDWWGQMAGIDAVNSYKNAGDVGNGPNKDTFNPNLYAKNNNNVGWGEFKDAYALWYNLIVKNTSWSTANTATQSKNDNASLFGLGGAAMTPAACWVEYESKEYLEAANQQVSLMPTPTVSNVVIDANGNVLDKTEANTAVGERLLDAIIDETETDDSKVVIANNKRYKRISFTSSFGDSVIIPSSSANKEMAKKFLLFMAKEENAKLFTEKSNGTILPYKYNYWETENASAWQKAIFEIDMNSTKFNNYTQHPFMRDTSFKSTAKMVTVWPENQYYYTNAFTAPNNDAYKPNNLFNKIWTDVINQKWSLWMNELN